MSEIAGDASEQPQQPRWRPLPPYDRRVLGVLAEKAKTTPEQYPLSLNALTTGCNQKSNRYPLMNLESDRVEEVLERLRGMGAVTEILGGGRVARFRHNLYEWLGVDKVELAVMAELLLRGTQTAGELRGRAARMEPIADIAALRPILRSLQQKGLVISLTPEGRGQTVTHGLYRPEELEKIRREAALAAPADAGTVDDSDAAADEEYDDVPERGVAQAVRPVSTAPEVVASVTVNSGSVSGNSPSADEMQQLRAEVGSLREEVARLKKEVDDIWSNIR